MSAVHLTKADFLTRVANYEANPNEWKFLGERPALIDFYATWCGPCKMLAPVLDELADEYAGQVDIYKVNADSGKDTEISDELSGYLKRLLKIAEDSDGAFDPTIGEADPPVGYWRGKPENSGRSRN